jgi:hypothetical protein
VSADGTHGFAGATAEVPGGAWTKWDRHVMRLLGQSDEAWAQARRDGLAWLAQFQDDVKASLAGSRP